MIAGIRHARVRNPEAVVYARLSGFHLSGEGQTDALALSNVLATAPIVAIAASPLERAKETAAILAGPHRLEVREDPRLNEWSFWVHWQGMPWSRIRERDPELLDAYASDPASAVPDSSLEMAGRDVLAWAQEAESEHRGGLVLGITHEAPLLAALLMGQERDLAEYHSHNLPHLAMVRLLPGPAEIVDPNDLIQPG